MTTSVILLMAGCGKRTGLKINKALYEINRVPCFIYSMTTLMKICPDQFFLVIAKNEYNEVLKILEDYGYTNKVTIVDGGLTRNESVRNALIKVSSDRVLIHDAARPLVCLEDIKSLLNNTLEAGTLYHDLTDTIKDISKGVNTVDRNVLRAVTTPQLFYRNSYEKILNNTRTVNDEIELVESDSQISFIKESSPNIKLTTLDDINLISFYLDNKKIYLVGHSLDYHRFGNEGNLVLGGVTFTDYSRLIGHSNADVIYHVVAEGILGAIAKGDLGSNFSDHDEKYKNIDSSYFVIKAVDMAKKAGYLIQNIDVMVYLERPRLTGYKELMIENIKKLTNAEIVSVKAATMNKGGIIATNEGIGAEAVCLLKKAN